MTGGVPGPTRTGTPAPATGNSVYSGAGSGTSGSGSMDTRGRQGDDGRIAFDGLHGGVRAGPLDRQQRHITRVPRRARP
jgi:hypothetical protein